MLIKFQVHLPLFGIFLHPYHSMKRKSIIGLGKNEKVRYFNVNVSNCQAFFFSLINHLSEMFKSNLQTGFQSL